MTGFTRLSGGRHGLRLWCLVGALLGVVINAKNAGAGLCPDDVADEALGFFQSYFDRECKVEWGFVPDSIKSDFDHATVSLLVPGDKGFTQKHTTCRIMTVTEGGALMFDVKPNPQSATEEDWTPLEKTVKRVDIVQGKEVVSSPCDVFHAGVPRYEIVGDKLDEVMTQIKEDVAQVCPSLGAYGAALHHDQGSTIKARRTMLEQDGEEGFTFDLKISVNNIPEPVKVQVWVQDDGADDEDAARDDMLERERDQDRTRRDENDDNSTLGAIQSNMMMQQKSLHARRAAITDDGAGVDDEEAAKTTAEKEAAEQAEAKNAANDDGSDEQDGKASQGGKKGRKPGPPLPAYGNWTVLDDLVSPPLCCLCDSNCSAACHGGEDAPKKKTLLEEEEETIAQQPEGTPQRVGLASFKAPEASLPPSRGGLHYGDRTHGQRKFRRQSSAGYGDNFHSTIMPKRTEADHAAVWAQSRALIETVKSEGITVPDEWHFYDDDKRARCWQEPPNQGECGSCWSFASLGALEKQICMRSHGTFVPNLSREHLVRCSEQNNACGGGNADKAYEDMMEFGGVLGTDCIPYQGDGSKHCPTFVYSWFGQGNSAKGMSRIDQELMKSCHNLQRYSNRPPIGEEWEMPFRMTYEQRWGSAPNMNDTRVARYRKNFAQSRGRDRVPSWWLYGEDAMKAALIKYGSVYASYRVRKDFKARICADGCWPPGTVWGEEPDFYEATCGCPSGHAVHIIGWGTDIDELGKRIPYWLIENSWGSEVHGNVLGEDASGLKGWGKDPFTEDHPMKAEDQCVLAGWASSTLPRTGGCGGNENVNIRKGVEVKEGLPDGFFLGVSMDGQMKLNVSVKEDSGMRFMATFPVAPGTHNISFMLYARNHPKQQSFPVETYNIRATSLRCRGTGYVYSFSKNDTKASLSWGRLTRKELEEKANQILRDNGINPDAKLDGCDSKCRTGRYSLQVPCLGLLMRWGSCYTHSWAYRSSYYQKNKLADCRNCSAAEIHNKNLAIATQNLPQAEFIKWHNLVQQAFTAPDDAGWMRKFRGSCVVNTGGFVSNAQLTATYTIHKPYGADGKGACDEKHSAPWAPGHFVNAPGFIANGGDASIRCPMPLGGNVSVHCKDAVLTVNSHTCHDRAPAPRLGNADARQFHSQCASEMTKSGCAAVKGTPGMPPPCVWTGADCARSSMGYFKILRGFNYHGIEEGASFAIAEMDRFVGECPTLGWSRWSPCSAAKVCEAGTQRRTRSLAPGYDMSNPMCKDLLLEETRNCVKPGFCPRVLARFAASAGPSVEGFMATYKTGSQTLPYARAGATMLHSGYPNCSEAKYWCTMITGAEKCGMYFEGHFQVKKDGDYFLKYEADSGAGELAFNSLGPGKELDPQFKITAGGDMYEWQDTGFHHRRRRTQVKPWVKTTSLYLPRGTYFARLTRTGWDCPNYRLRLERLTSIYSPPLLFGGHSNDRDALGRSRQTQTQWNNLWGAINAHYLRYRERGYHGYPKSTETGMANEILLRPEGSTSRGVVKKVPVTKLNFTADELYTLFGIDKLNPPFARYVKYELVIRSTVVLPDSGNYKFKYQQDTSPDATNAAWRQSSRRRQSKVAIRAGGTSKQHATLDRYSGSAELDVSYIATDPGITTFEVSTLCGYEGIDDKAALPNYLAVEIKLEDMLHGASLDFGTKTRYISDIDTLMGDGKVRIDWPDRDDPLSGALRTSTFEGVPPAEILIGTKNLKGFAALAEGKIDAGACLTLEARVQGQETLTFRGFGLELCDVDGASQYLAIKSYSRRPGSNVTNAKRLGWVHISFNHPTHLQMIRSPTDLKKIELGYKPDDREFMAAPFPADALLAELGSFDGEMEVGVSMNTPEAYRYAEFYNISIEACPDSCTSPSGAQLYCGKVRTPCGTELDCSASCGGTNGVCQDNKCFDCPPVPASAVAGWECGTITQVCSGREPKSDLQVDRTVGVPSPGPAYFCGSNNTWECHGTTQWGFLARGLKCGTTVDECGTTVQLLSCHYANDVCVDHKCVCQPATFDATFDCGWNGDGCGRNVTFGSLDGLCASGKVCHQKMCCAPKTKADFDGSWECGSEPDGCGGKVSFQKATGSPYMKQPAVERYSSYHTGWIGTKIQTIEAIKIDSLAVGLIKVAGSFQQLSRNATVSIWNEAGTVELFSTTIKPTALHKDGYAWVNLSSPVELPKDAKFMILTHVHRGEKYSNAYTYSSTRGRMMDTSLARYVGGVKSYTQTPTRTYTSTATMVGVVNFGVVVNDGCGAGRAACTDHKCVTPAYVGFEVKKGPCTVTDGGKCVQSPNYPQNYGSREFCEILPPDEKFSAVHFDSEMYYDYLKIGGRRYQGRRRRYSTSAMSHKYVGPRGVSASTPMTWTSDGSGNRKGFRICVEGTSLAETDEQEGEQQEEDVEEDSEEDEGLKEEKAKIAAEEEEERSLAEENEKLLQEEQAAEEKEEKEEREDDHDEKEPGDESLIEAEDEGEDEEAAANA